MATGRPSSYASTSLYRDAVALERKLRKPGRHGHQVVDSEEVGSPGWWLRRLLNRLDVRSQLHNLLWDYYEGMHPLPWIHDLELVPQFDRLQRIAKTNYLPLVTEAVEERLNVEGFRFGDEPKADDDAWETWQANDLDEMSEIAHLMGFVTGISYTLTWPNRKDPTDPLVWVEDSLNVIHEPATGRGLGRCEAAVKAWHDDRHGLDRAEVYLPNGIHRWVRASTESKTARWEPHDDPDERHEPLPDEFRRVWKDGIVPVVPLIPRPDRYGEGRSEFIESIPIQDRINQTTFDRLVGQHYSSFQQVVGIGVEPEVDPETGQEENPLKRRPGRAWLVEIGGDVKAIEPQNIDIMLNAIEQDISAMARISRTPPNYLSSKMQFPSGDAIRSAEASLIKKAARRSRQLGGGWELTMRYAAAARGNRGQATDPKVETIWGDVAIRTEGELVDALVKMSTLGVPAEALWERWGASQTEIKRWRALRNADAFARGLETLPDVTTAARDEPEVDDDTAA